MKMQRVSRRSVALGGILAASLAVLAVEQARAFNPQPDPPGRFRFGMVGLAAGQTARLNVVIDPNDPTNPPVAVELTFLDSNGDVFTRRDGTQARTTVQLMAGQSAFLDLDFGEIPYDSARVQLRAVVRAQPSDTGERGKRHRSDPEWLPTLEVFDIETGRTQVVLAPGSTRFIKEVDPAPQSQR